MKLPRTRPVIGLPFSVAIGISIRIVRALGHVPLPSHPEQREPLPHQRAVAELRLGRRIGRAAAFWKVASMLLPPRLPTS